MRAKFIYEAIKHLSGRTHEDILDRLSPEEVLVWGAKTESEALVKSAIDKGADVNFDNSDALEWAVNNKHIEIVKLLLDEGAKITDWSFSYACFTGTTELVKLLIDNGADVHAIDDRALRWARDNKNNAAEIIELLTQHSADVNEAIKHLTPRSGDEIRKTIINARPEEAFPLAKKYNIELSREEIEKILEHEPLFDKLDYAKQYRFDWLHEELYAELTRWAKRTRDISLAIQDMVDRDYPELLEFLLKRAKGKNEAAIDEDTYAYAVSKGINILPYITEMPSSDFDFEKIGLQYYLMFKDWDVFATFFVDDRNHFSIDSIATILKGEGLDDFFGDYEIELPDFSNRFLEKIDVKLCNYLKILFEKSHPEAEQYTNFRDLYHYIQKLDEDAELDDDIREAISRATTECQKMADYDECYKGIMDAVTDFFEISDVKWLDKGGYKVKITEKGLNTLLGLCYNSDIVDKIDYTSPYYGYQGDIEKSPDSFSDSLYTQLENL